MRAQNVERHNLRPHVCAWPQDGPSARSLHRRPAKTDPRTGTMDRRASGPQNRTLAAASTDRCQRISNRREIPPSSRHRPYDCPDPQRRCCNSRPGRNPVTGSVPQITSGPSRTLMLSSGSIGPHRLFAIVRNISMFWSSHSVYPGTDDQRRWSRSQRRRADRYRYTDHRCHAP